jgi:signal transduction histidine kinase
MCNHVRIVFLGGMETTASVIEHRLTTQIPASITTVDFDPVTFRNSLHNRQFDIAMVDGDALSSAPDGYLDQLIAEFGHRPFLLLLDEHLAGTVRVRGRNWSVMSKRPGFVTEIPPKLKLICRRMAESVPGRRAAEILACGGDNVPHQISQLEDDLNNPLLAISATVELLLKESHRFDAATLARLEVIQESALRMQKSIISLSRAVREGLS